MHVILGLNFTAPRWDSNGLCSVPDYTFTFGVNLCVFNIYRIAFVFSSSDVLALLAGCFRFNGVLRQYFSI